LILLLIRAARIHPLLPVAFVLALFLAVFLLLRCTMSRGNKEMLDTLKGTRQSVQPSPSPSPTGSSARGQRLSAHPDPAVASTPLHLPVPPPPKPLPSTQVVAMPKSHSQQSHQSVLLGHQEGSDEDHDEEVKPFEDDSSQSSLPRPHHPHVVLPANQEETKPSSHEAMHLAPAMVTPLGTSPPTVAPSAAADAGAGTVSMDLVADAKKGDDEPKIIRRADSHSIEIRDVRMGDNYLLVWDSEGSSSSLNESG
jgi:hypothetical protein